MISENIKYVIAPYMKAAYYSKNLELGFGSIKKTITEKRIQNAIIELCEALKSAKTLNEMKDSIKAKYLLENSEIESIISLFQSQNFLIEKNLYDRSERYSRHKLFYNMSGGQANEIQDRFSKTHVTILGCGGIGNLISVNLATAGIGKLTLIDEDAIEISNLTRQILFSESDVGALKSTILERELKKRASNIAIESVNSMIDTMEKAETLLNGDLVVLCGDSPGIAKLVNQACYKKGIPFLNVGYIQDIAVWGPFFIPGETPCYECFSKNNIATSDTIDMELKKKLELINIKYQSPSIGPVNMLAASLASLDLLKMLGRFGQVQADRKRIGVWTHSLKIEEQLFESNVYCSLCDNKKILTETRSLK